MILIHLESIWLEPPDADTHVRWRENRDNRVGDSIRLLVGRFVQQLPSEMQSRLLVPEAVALINQRTSNGHWVNYQTIFINEPRFYNASGKTGSAMRQNIFAGLLFQISDFFGKITISYASLAPTCRCRLSFAVGPEFGRARLASVF